MTIKPRPESGPPEERAAAFDHYVFDTHGRPVTPTLLGNGNRIIFVAVGRAFAATSSNPVATFDAGFDEMLEPRTKVEIHGATHTFFTIGLDPRDVIALAGGHQKITDSSLPGSKGRLTDDMHLGFIRVLARTGKQWSPYFYWEDRKGLVALQEVINYRYDLTSPRDPENARLLYCPDRYKARWLPRADWMEQFVAEATHAHSKTPFQNQTDLVTFAKLYPGVTEAEAHKHFIYLTVKETKVCVKGRLATSWHYHSPELYARKPYATYFADLERSVAVRWDRHTALSGRQPRRRRNDWLNLLPFEPLSGLVVVQFRQPTKPTKEALIMKLALGGEPPVPPVPIIDSLGSALSMAAVQDKAGTLNATGQTVAKPTPIAPVLPKVIARKSDDDPKPKGLPKKPEAATLATAKAGHQEHVPAIGKATPAKPERTIEDLIASLHTAVGPDKNGTPKTANEAHGSLKRVAADFSWAILWAFNEDNRRGRLALKAEADKRAKTFAADQELQFLVRAVNAHVAELEDRELQRNRDEGRDR